MKHSHQCIRTLGLAVGLVVTLGLRAAEAGKSATPAGATLNASEAEVLLNLFQEKGLISAQDVEKARAELARRAARAAEAAAGESKIKIAKWIEGVELYGDARLRYEYRGGENGDAAGNDHLERSRWRYRLRAGARMEFTDHFRAGIRVETGPRGRSSNVTFGDDVGPWGKDSDRIHLGLLYLNWGPASWFSATAGRQENLFQVTSLVWDHDLTPEGLSEAFTCKVGRFDLFATFGQFIYDDSEPGNPFGAVGFNDAFLFVNQVGMRYHFNKDVSAQIAPVIHVYSDQDSSRGPFVGTTLANTPGINDLLVLGIPTEVKFKIGSVPARVFGDFAVNLEGKDRARAAGTPQFDDEVYAWQAGAELGSAKKKGGWSVRAFYQMSDLYALDPNLVDSDLFDSRLNMKGFVVQGSYAFTDFLSFTVTYANADRKNKSLPTGAVGDLGLPWGTSFLENYQQFQADLNLKF